MTKTSDTHQVHAAWQGYDLWAPCSPLKRGGVIYSHHLLGGVYMYRGTLVAVRG